MTQVWREAIDSYQAQPEQYAAKQQWMSQLAKLSEGSQTTLGAYQKAWQ